MPLQQVARASKSWNAAHRGRTRATREITAGSLVKSCGIYERRDERRRTLNRPTTMEAMPATRALVLAAVARVAPIRFAILVEAAMEIGKGILGWGGRC